MGFREHRDAPERALQKLETARVPEAWRWKLSNETEFTRNRNNVTHEPMDEHRSIHRSIVVIAGSEYGESTRHYRSEPDRFTTLYPAPVTPTIDLEGSADRVKAEQHQRFLLGLRGPAARERASEPEDTERSSRTSIPPRNSRGDPFSKLYFSGYSIWLRLPRAPMHGLPGVSATFG